MEVIFSKCVMMNCYTFLEARFYTCPGASHEMNMSFIPDISYDYGDKGILDDVLKQQISLMRERKFLGTYDYCDDLENHV